MANLEFKDKYLDTLDCSVQETEQTYGSILIDLIFFNGRYILRKKLLARY